MLEEVYPRSLSEKQLSNLVGISRSAINKSVMVLLKDESIEVTEVVDAKPKKYRLFRHNKSG